LIDASARHPFDARQKRAAAPELTINMIPVFDGAVRTAAWVNEE